MSILPTADATAQGVVSPGLPRIRGQYKGHRYTLTCYDPKRAEVAKLIVDENGPARLYANATHRGNGGPKLLPKLRDAVQRELSQLGSSIDVDDVKPHPTLDSHQAMVRWTKAGRDITTATLLFIATRRAMLSV
jgi:hypothetical protein